MKKITTPDELQDLREKYYSPQELAEIEAFRKGRRKGVKNG